MEHVQTSKPRYLSTNWKEYSAVPKARGLLAVWLDMRMFSYQLVAATITYIDRVTCSKNYVTFLLRCRSQSWWCDNGVGKYYVADASRKPTGSRVVIYATSPRTPILKRFTELGRSQAVAAA